MDLHFFNISLLKHCTLHIVNLGLLGVANGAVLCPCLDLKVVLHVY